MQGIPGQPTVPFKSKNSLSFSSSFKKKYSHLLDNPEHEQNTLNTEKSSTLSSPSKKLVFKKSSKDSSFQNDFFAQEAPNDSSVFGEKQNGSFQSLTNNEDNKDLLTFSPQSFKIKDSSSGKRHSQSFTPSQPERYNKSLSFWKAEDPLSEPSVIDQESNHTQNISKSKFGMTSLVEGDSSPYLLDHDVPSDIASADHTFESNGTKENIRESPEKSVSVTNGGMVGESFERTGFSFTSNMLLDHHNVPDAAEQNTSSSIELNDVSGINNDKILSEALLEQVMPESPLSYRPSPLAKYASSNLSQFQSSSPFLSSANGSSPCSSPSLRNQKFGSSLSPSAATIPSTPVNSQETQPVSTTPVDILKRRLERSEETLHQYEHDLVQLQSQNTKLEEMNSVLRKELDEERKRVYMEENEAYELEQDRDLYKQENEGLRSQIDEIMQVLRMRDTVEMEQTVELSETIIKLEASQRKCSVLEDQVAELARINEDLSKTESDRYAQLLKTLEQSEKKCSSLENELNNFGNKQEYQKKVMNSIETQSDFLLNNQKLPSKNAWTQIDVSVMDAINQTDDDLMSQSIPEDLSAYIVNKDESIFNHEQFQNELNESELGLGEKLKIEKLLSAMEQNDAKMAEVKSNMNEIHSKTMQVRQDLLLNSHFGKEVERWVDDMKISVECVETFILEANQALKVEKRRSERLNEMIRKKPLDSKDCQTDSSSMDSKYVQTKNESIFLNAGIQTIYPNMIDQDIQTDYDKPDVNEEDSLELLLSSHKPLVDPSSSVKVDTASQTMLLFDMMDPDFASRRRHHKKHEPAHEGLYGSNTFTGNLIQLFITLLCLLIGYILYNMYELFGFLRSVVRIAKESKVAIM